MPSRLSRFCEGIIEAAWLSAVILIPVFFNNYSGRIFEPDKAALLRSLALAALAAWVVKLVDQGVRWDGLRSRDEKPSLGSHLGNLLRVPLALPVFALAFSYTLSTALSVIPNDSWGGSYYRLQGLYTTLAYLVFFAALLGNLRQRSQMTRLVTAIILASIPIIIYALLQRVELEPLIISRRENEWQRVTSNLGAPVFLAAYLILIFPLTVMRGVQSLTALIKREGSRLRSGLLTGLYLALGVLQVWTVLLTGSRGAFLGLVLGALAFFILLSIYWRKRWPVVLVAGIGLALFAFLFLLGLPNGPFQSLMENQTLGNTFTRFARIFDETGDSARFRIVTWQTARNVFDNLQALEFLDGSRDALSGLRQLIGYGPETQWAVSPRFYVVELMRTAGRYLLTDRYHNELWDVLVTTGGLGLVLQMAFHALLTYLPLRWLGVVNGRRMSGLFWGAYFGFGLAGAAFLVWRQGANFGWMGYMFGTTLGVLAYLAMVALFARLEKLPLNLPLPYALLSMASLAAVLAHWIEFSVSFTIVSTGMLLFIFAAVIVLAGLILPRLEKTEPAGAVPLVQAAQEARPAAAATRGRRRGDVSAAQRFGRARGAGALWSLEKSRLGVDVLLVGILFATLGYIFLQVSSSNSIFRVIGDSLFKINGSGANSWPALLLMLLGSWLVGCLLLALEHHAGEKTNSWLRSFGWMVLFSGLAGMVFWFAQAGGLVSLIQGVQRDANNLLARAQAFEGFLALYYAFILAVLLGIAWLLAHPWPQRSTPARLAGKLAAGVSLVLVLGLIVFTNLRPIQADSGVAAAQPFVEQGYFSLALETYDRIITINPGIDHYYSLTGKAYLGAATSQTDLQTAERYLKLSEERFRQGLELNPLNGDYLTAFGTLYSNWATRVSDPTRRSQLAQQSDQYFTLAAHFNPQDADVWTKWAYLQSAVINQPEAALQSIQRALQIYPSGMPYALLGDYYTTQGRGLQGEERRQAFASAVENYKKALSFEPSRSMYWLALGGAYVEIGEYQEAVDAFSTGRAGYPPAEVWQVDQAIAGLYYQMGQKQPALDALLAALQTAPQSALADLQALQAAIEALP